jgi:hypothetical protein
MATKESLMAQGRWDYMHDRPVRATQSEGNMDQQYQYVGAQTAQRGEGIAYAGGALAGTFGPIMADKQINPTALDQHEKALAAIVSELGDLCGRACGLADRMFGPSPEPVGQNEKEPAQPPQIRRIENLASAAHQRLSALKGYMQRLERL